MAAKGTCNYEIIEDGSNKILLVDCQDALFVPAIEDSQITMGKIITRLIEYGRVDQISFLQKEEYLYDTDQTQILVNLAMFIRHLIEEKQTLLDDEKMCTADHSSMYAFVNDLILRRMKYDPISAYVELDRRIRELRIKLSYLAGTEHKVCVERYLAVLDTILSEFSDTLIIKLSAPYLPGYKPGDREVYKKLFRPIIRPNFIYTKLITDFPTGAEEIDSYKLRDGSRVMILNIPDEIRPIYHIIPPEFGMDEMSYDVLISARQILAEHKPEQSEFIDPRRTREIFFSVERDLIRDLADSKGLNLKPSELDELTEILIRYTIGFGMVEVLLEDEKLQDISINAPAGASPVFVVHEEFGECITNFTITDKEAESWASKFRLSSGRPLDESNPVLDTNLDLPYARARIAIIQRPLSPDGLAFSVRRHRDKPWTLPLFIKNRMLTPLAAGLISFAVDGARTMLVAGTRSAGKTSLLSACLVEIMRSARIITVEDTLELPVNQLRTYGYDIQSMKVQSVITRTDMEMPASEGIRTSLRLGDSSLIVGEVRSKEAVALYEAMRVGALANVVAGTIHGDSPYGVFDRVVNDLGVPRTSFKATDLILVANPVKSASGLETSKRMVQFTEVRKQWTDDPLVEHGFADLMSYNTKTDELDPTDVLVEGESEIIKNVASRVREWAGNWDAVWDNIQLRTDIKKTLVETAEKHNMPSILEAQFVIISNDQFHKICQQVSEEVGFTDPKRVFSEWNNWLDSKIRTEKRQRRG